MIIAKTSHGSTYVKEMYYQFYRNLEFAKYRYNFILKLSIWLMPSMLTSTMAITFYCGNQSLLQLIFKFNFRALYLKLKTFLFSSSSPMLLLRMY